MTRISSARKPLPFGIDGFRLIVPSLFAFAALLLSAPAQAETTLVSNLSQIINSSHANLVDRIKVGQKFTTGNDGATLTSVDIDFRGWDEYEAYLTVKLHEASSSNVLGNEIVALEKPWKHYSCGIRTFTVPSGETVALAANTTYMIVLSGYVTSRHTGVFPELTDSDSEDSGGMAGWTIANERVINPDADNPSTIGSIFQMAIKGYTGTDSPSYLDEDGVEASVPNPPTRHEGLGKTFYFDLHLTQPILMPWKDMRGHVFTITGGGGVSAKRIDKQRVLDCRRERTASNHWRIGVLPDGNGPVTVELEAKRSCDDQGAICTADRKRLKNEFSFTVNGPEIPEIINQNEGDTQNEEDTSGPSISVGDTSATENDGYIKFPVTLSQKFPNHKISFDVTLGGGTAKPNVDYWAFGKTFVIDENKTRLNAAISLRDDNKQEGDETFRIKLSNARILGPGTPIHIEDGEATGTIIDDESTSDNDMISIFPNPFNPSTQITYRLDRPGVVKLRIYNILGQPVRTLVDEEQVAGRYRVLWDARNEQGTAVASGIYLTRLIYPGGVQTQQLLLLK